MQRMPNWLYSSSHKRRFQQLPKVYEGDQIDQKMRIQLEARENLILHEDDTDGVNATLKLLDHGGSGETIHVECSLNVNDTRGLLSSVSLCCDNGCSSSCTASCTTTLSTMAKLHQNIAMCSQTSTVGNNKADLFQRYEHIRLTCLASTGDRRIQSRSDLTFLYGRP